MEEKFYIDFEPITPIYIGAGDEKDWINGFDIIMDKGNAYVIDMKKIINQGIDVNRLTACFLNRDITGVKQLLSGKLNALSKYVLKCPSVGTNSNVKAFIRSQLKDRPIIPGSSIKGAIRSVLFSHLRKNGEQRNEQVFDKMKDGRDFMRFIQISDIEVKKTKLFNSKIFNLQLDGNEWIGGWKHSGGRQSETSDEFRPSGFNTIYECIYSDEANIGYGSIVLKSEMFNTMCNHLSETTPYASEKSKLLHGGLTALFAVINAHTRAYLLKEKAFFTEFEADRSDEIVECIDYLLEQLDGMEDNTSCLLKMSAGSGFHSITGDWQYEDYTETGEWETGKNAGKLKYKSRKIIQENGTLSLMGFIVLSQTTKQNYEQRVLTQ